MKTQNGSISYIFYKISGEIIHGDFFPYGKRGELAEKISIIKTRW